MEICIVSHSAQLADGLKELLAQMADGVVVRTTGGIDGNIGTSVDAITEMFNSVQDEALCFYDIGSSKMNVEMVIEMNSFTHITVAHMPLVEGAFLASVESKVGKSRDEILASLKKTFKEKE